MSWRTSDRPSPLWKAIRRQRLDNQGSSVLVMLMTPHWISGLDGRRLGIMPRPRGGDWLEDEIRDLKALKVDVVACLLEAEELVELDLDREPAFCRAYGIEYRWFPIRDRDVPDSILETAEFVRGLGDCIMERKSVVIHCRQGVGRSAVIAACLTANYGFSGDQAFEQIAKARGCNVPDTDEQRLWVDRFLRVGTRKSI